MQNYARNAKRALIQKGASAYRVWKVVARSESVANLSQGRPTPPSNLDEIRDNYVVRELINAYQEQGHLAADLDPLQLWRKHHLEQYSVPTVVFSSGYLPELEKTFLLPKTCFIGGSQKELKLREIIRRLNKVYCRGLGTDLSHVAGLKEITWLREKIEKPYAFKGIVSNNDRKEALWRLGRATLFEAFLARKWPSEKRFGLEGCDALIPGLQALINFSASKGTNICNIAMAHRGRLNVLTNVVKTPLEKLLATFQEVDMLTHGSGDVKYHLGQSVTSINEMSDKPFVVSLMANPSHLEASGSPLLGKTKAHQFFLKDEAGEQVLPIIIHGDAATSGQGIVYETFMLSHFPGYNTQGIVHIVLNNQFGDRLTEAFFQIGFTTDPVHSRSGEYCSDVAKVIGAPVLHVNADHVDAVIFAFTLAAEFRLLFRSDILVELVGYRRFGHNEADDPTLTQPHMYKIIQKIPNAFKKYSEKLIDAKVVVQELIGKEVEKYEAFLEKSFIESTNIKSIDLDDWLDSPWPGHFKNKDILAEPETGGNKLWLEGLARRMTQQPSLRIHPKSIKRLRASHDKVVDNKLDWSLMETITFASLLTEGIHVRLSGLEAERGCHMHRMHLFHTENNQVFTPLDFAGRSQSIYSLFNSPMSDYAVAGFEAGYSMVSPHQLVIWECLFGDRSVGAQIIIDQYICSGERKWKRQSGVVLMLPHGMDGQGADYSSARPERLLQLVDDDEKDINLEKSMMERLYECNMVVANLTLPSNLFHLLRRHTKTTFRKPLILLTPKAIMNDPDFFSTFEDLDVGTKFKHFIPDSETTPSLDVVAYMLCTGQVYYHLKRERNIRHLKGKVAIVRVEQLSPFPYKEFLEDFKKYENAKLVWVQEEHRNQGYWDYIKPRLETVLNAEGKIRYAGRQSAGVAATDTYSTHLAEQATVMEEAFSIL